ncbi:MAG: hypothetical protein KA035_01965 [Candidatus Levybacteria bacterium]|nr:hypothetical protein [Candidatus Levybacteria bacterium]
MTNPETPRDFRKLASERIMGELEATRLWYQRGLERFGEMTVENAPLTDGKNWKATLAPNGEVEMVDGAFFTLIGQHVTRKKPDGSTDFEWTQPDLKQKEGQITMPTPEGEMLIQTSGFVGIILDEDNRALLALAQEPFAKTPKNVLIRTPFQASVAKLAGLMEGNRQLDPVLYDLLMKFGDDGDIKNVFAGRNIDLFPLPFADANRIEASNTGFALRVTDEALHQQLEMDGQNRWCSSRAISYITRAGLLNGHTANGYLAAQSSF